MKRGTNRTPQWKVITRVVRSRLKGVSSEETLFYSAKFLVQVAQNLLLAALFVEAGTGSHAAIGLSSLFVALTLPSVIFGFFGGAIADRIGPARGFFAGSMLRLAVCAVAAILAGGSIPTWAIAFAYQALSQVSASAELALVRNLRADAPGRAHSVIVAVQYVGQALGMLGLAPALYFLGGTRAMFAGAAVICFVLVGATALLAVRLRGTAAARMLPTSEAFSFRHTLRVFRERRPAREAVAVLAMKSMIAQGIVVALPLYMKNDPLMGHWSLASLLIPGSLGTIAGLLWATSAGTTERARSIMRISLLGMVVSVLSYTALDYGIVRVPPVEDLGPHAVTTLALALVVAFILGVALAASMVSARAALTETAPLGTQSRVFALQSSLSDGCVALPVLALGFGGTFAGSGSIFAALGLVSGAVLLAIAWPSLGFGTKATEPALGDA